MIRLTFHSSGPATQAAEFKRWAAKEHYQAPQAGVQQVVTR
jgi:hypothetical protein